MIKLEVSTHGGDVDIVEVSEYNPIELVVELNNEEVHAISIGNNIYSRIDVKNIKPLDN